MEQLIKNSLYHPMYEHDACGFGFVCNVNGKTTHKIVNQGIEILKNLNHRTALADERNSGDGAGIMFSIPHNFFQIELQKQNLSLPKPDEYAVGQIMFFDKHESGITPHYKELFTKCLKENGMNVIGWRTVPTTKNLIGTAPASMEPSFEQVFISFGKKLSKKTHSSTKEENRLFYERRLFLARRKFEKIVDKNRKDPFINHKKVYICSLSTYKIVYKGQLVPTQMGEYFYDLNSPLFSSRFAMVHGRF